MGTKKMPCIEELEKSLADGRIKVVVTYESYRNGLIAIGYLYGVIEKPFLKKDDEFLIIVYRGMVDLYTRSLPAMNLLRSKLIHALRQRPESLKGATRDAALASFAELDTDGDKIFTDFWCIDGNQMYDSSDMEFHIKIGSFEEHIEIVPQ